MAGILQSLRRRRFEAGGQASGRTYVPLAEADYYSYGSGPEHQFFSGQLTPPPLKPGLPTPPQQGPSTQGGGGSTAGSILGDAITLGKTIDTGAEMLGYDAPLSGIKDYIGGVLGTGSAAAGSAAGAGTAGSTVGAGSGILGAGKIGTAAGAGSAGAGAGAAGAGATGAGAAGTGAGAAGAGGGGGAAAATPMAAYALPAAIAVASIFGSIKAGSMGRSPGDIRRDNQENLEKYLNYHPDAKQSMGTYTLGDGRQLSMDEMRHFANEWVNDEGVAEAPDKLMPGISQYSTPEEVKAYENQLKLTGGPRNVIGMASPTTPEWLTQGGNEDVLAAMFGQPYAEGGVLGQAGEFITGGGGSGTHYVEGPGDGREDKIPARLSNGEYVFDAETVALLGNGSSDAGAARLDEMRRRLRAHKGKKLAKGKFSDNAKDPMSYLGEKR